MEDKNRFEQIASSVMEKVGVSSESRTALSTGNAMSLNELLQRDFGFQIPTQSVPLPTRGIIYPPEHPLHKQETVDIRSMTSTEEDILTSKALVRKGTVITELINACVVNKRIDVRTLIAGDRLALMVAIRITGYTQEYTTKIECASSECKQMFEQTFDLAQLPIKRLMIAPCEEFSNLFEMILPVTKLPVRFRFLTGVDEEDLSATAEKKKKIGHVRENNVTSQLIKSIVSVNGVTDRNKISQLSQHLPAQDSLSLRKFMSDNEPGVDMHVTLTCPFCGDSRDTMMPIGVNFFWPNADV